jgi:predicted nucleic acid-binding Zn ribbon protein
VSDPRTPPDEPGADETGRIPVPDDASGGGQEPPEGGDGDGEGPGGEPPPPQPRCEVCDAPLEPDQTYCLECGSPTPLAPRIRRRGKAALIIAGALVLLGIGAGALAYAVATRSETKTVTGAVATPGTIATNTVPTAATGTAGTLPTDTTATFPTATGTPTSTAGTGTGGTPLPTDTGFTTVTSPSTAPTATAPTTEAPTTTEAPPSTTAASGGSDWPAGRAGWTAIVASEPTRAKAEADKCKLQAAGEPAGVLNSSDFSSLKPGYWVAFSGVFSSQSAAASQAAKLRPSFPGAYPRHIAS